MSLTSWHACDNVIICNGAVLEKTVQLIEHLKFDLSRSRHISFYVSQETAFLFWFTTTCHELAHNGESCHNEKHETLMEELVARYMVQAVEASKEF